MNIKDRVLSSLKTSFAKYGFKKDELNQLAEMISANLTDESSDEDVKSAVKTNEGYAKMMQSVYNRAVSETNDKFKDYVPKADKNATGTNLTTEPTTEPSADKSLSQEDILKLINEGIANGLKPYQEQAQKEKLKALLSNNAKLKDVPQIFRERYTLDKEENLDNVVNQINTDWTTVKQGLVQNGIMVEAPRKGAREEANSEFRKMMEDSAKRVAEKQSKQ